MVEELVATFVVPVAIYYDDCCLFESVLFNEICQLLHTILQNFSASEVLDNHKSVLTSFGIQTTDEELDLQIVGLLAFIERSENDINDIIDIVFFLLDKGHEAENL